MLRWRQQILPKAVTSPSLPMTSSASSDESLPADSSVDEPSEIKEEETKSAEEETQQQQQETSTKAGGSGTSSVEATAMAAANVTEQQQQGSGGTEGEEGPDMIRAMTLHAHIIMTFKAHPIVTDIKGPNPNNRVNSEGEETESLQDDRRKESSSDGDNASQVTNSLDKPRKLSNVEMGALLGSYAFITMWHTQEETEDHDPLTLVGRRGKKILKLKTKKKYLGPGKKLRKREKPPGATGLGRIKGKKSEEKSSEQKAEDDEHDENDSWQTCAPFSYSAVYSQLVSQRKVINQWLDVVKGEDRDEVLNMMVKWTHEPLQPPSTNESAQSNTTASSTSTTSSPSTTTTTSAATSSTRETPSLSSAWERVASGEYKLKNTSTLVLTGSAQVLSHGKGLQPIPDEVAKSETYQALFGSSRVLAVQLPSYTNHSIYRYVFIVTLLLVHHYIGSALRLDFHSSSYPHS